jgi:uncharacterized protein (DUF1778 family)
VANQQQKKPRKVGRPKLPKGEAKGKIVPVRLDPDDLRLVTAAAKANDEALSEWIRNALRSAAEVQMFQRTLHEAMQLVLSERPNLTATTSELSDEIERRGLYLRKDGATASAQQINARARKYPQLFEVTSVGSVRLLGNSTANTSAA